MDRARSSGDGALQSGRRGGLGGRVPCVFRSVSEAATRELGSEVEAFRGVARGARAWLPQPRGRDHLNGVLCAAVVHLLVLLHVPLLLDHSAGWIKALLVEADGLRRRALASDSAALSLDRASWCPVLMPEGAHTVLGAARP